MRVATTIERLGGSASWQELRRAHSRRAIESAVTEGEVVHPHRNVYVTGRASAQLVAARTCAGTLSHLSAALAHGWRLKCVPEQAWVTIPRTWGSRPAPPQVRLHRADLSAGEVVAGVTAPLRTVIDCARRLPFDEALTVADSALRSGTVSRTELRAAADLARGPGCPAVRRVAAHASAKAANPLESVLRALTVDVGLLLVPQLQVSESGLFAIVDLGSEELRLIVEADGYETHGTRKGLRRDCQRHTEFAVWGWTSLRYAYEHAMFEQDWVRWSLHAWLARQAGLPVSSPPRRARWPLAS